MAFSASSAYSYDPDHVPTNPLVIERKTTAVMRPCHGRHDRIEIGVQHFFRLRRWRIAKVLLILLFSRDNILTQAETPSPSTSNSSPSWRPTTTEPPSVNTTIDVPSVENSTKPSIRGKSLVVDDLKDTLAPTTSSEPTLSPMIRTRSEQPSIQKTTEQTSHPTAHATFGQSAAPTNSLSTDKPSHIPTLSQYPSQDPSEAPTSLPTTARPSATPSLSHTPTVSPSESPTLSPTLSLQPSTATPSSTPSSSPTISLEPSPSPTAQPTSEPTISMPPSSSPSESPSTSMQPSSQPSSPPTVSLAPSSSPTTVPTMSMAPSGSPSNAPSESPSALPSSSPSSAPTLEETSSHFLQFRQDLTRATASQGVSTFGSDELDLIKEIMENYTKYFASDERVVTTCIIFNQNILKRRRQLTRTEQIPKNEGNEKEILTGIRGSNRKLAVTNEFFVDVFVNEILFSMTYESNNVDTSDYPSGFRSFINDNLDRVTEDLNAVGLDVIETGRVWMFGEKTASPTFAPTNQPTMEPTGFPTAIPSHLPSVSPSFVPSSLPTPGPSHAPTHAPTPNRPTPQLSILQSKAPSGVKDSGDSNATIFAVVAIGFAGAAMVAFLFFYKKRKVKTENDLVFPNSFGGGGTRETFPQEISITEDNGSAGRTNEIANDPYDHTDDVMAGPEMYLMRDSDNNKHASGEMIETGGSLLSNQSLVSVGHSFSGDSVTDDEDGTHQLFDEFDEYKDQNLELMRTVVEGSLTNFDSMMSHALTNALIDDFDESADMNELFWGSNGDSTEIEATVLCEVNDWLKRKEEDAGLDERRGFMQEMLNKMVGSVRHGIIEPEIASRAIHESAAMLGMELAADIPENALVVTGMRKMVEKDDVIRAFREFGEIDDAAVAANARGFGLVRYTGTKSVQRAMERFRTGEIVVQDVAVMVKVVKPE